MLNWNAALFVLIDAPAHPNAWAVQVATILANSPLIVGPAVLIALWVWGPPSGRGPLLAVAGALLVGQGINQLLGAIYFEPRPFMIGLGHTLMQHAPDNSFPSDHATFVWTLGIGLIATGAGRRWGLAVCVYGVGVAWSRVFLGIHFPDDMAASALVAVVSGSAAQLAAPAVTTWLLPYADSLYEASLAALRLPPSLVPRRTTPRRAAH